MESIDKIQGTFEKRIAELQKQNISVAVIKRLPRYHRYLGELLREGIHRISSAELSRIMNVTASQIRQDLNCFGGFGQQGYGYNVKHLYGKISELLGVNEGYKTVIVGAGNLGKALAATHMFDRRGVTRTAMFDTNQALVGTEIYGIPVYNVDYLGDFCQKHRIDIAVLTVPKEAAKSVTDVLIAAGIKGIWNFANMELTVEDENVVVENIHLGDSLMTLCYEVKNRAATRSEGEEEKA
jgi:redox-sensing transcriptional repressor